MRVQEYAIIALGGIERTDEEVAACGRLALVVLYKARRWVGSEKSLHDGLCFGRIVLAFLLGQSQFYPLIEVCGEGCGIAALYGL